MRAERGNGKYAHNVPVILILRRILDGEWSLRPESVLSRVAYELLWRVLLLDSGLRPSAAEVRTIDAAEHKSALINRRPAEVRVDSA